LTLDSLEALVFTGIIEQVGSVSDTRPRGGGLEIHVSAVLPGEPLAIGESVAVSGPCLTVERVVPGGFVVFASPETTDRTTVAGLRRGDSVNLERAMPAGGRFGGHIVSGHVDGVGRLVDRVSRGEATELVFEAPESVMKFLVAKGSIAIDGISLTINDAGSGRFSVMIIPHTLAKTTLGDARPGTRVNLEVDVLARYVHAFTVSGARGITPEMLAEMGW
jgi:riboflavin synthase